MSLPSEGSAERPKYLPKHGAAENKKNFEQVARQLFCVFLVVPPKITSYIEDEMGGRRGGGTVVRQRYR
eukprot:COSAG05_NODE_11501_length_510_cov_1.133820_2_plen_68_part_01